MLRSSSVHREKYLMRTHTRIFSEAYINRAIMGRNAITSLQLLGLAEISASHMHCTMSKRFFHGWRVVLAVFALVLNSNVLIAETTSDPNPVPNSSNSDAILKRDGLAKEALEYSKDGDFIAAAASGEQALSIQRERLGPNDVLVQALLEFCATMHEKVGAWDGATENRRELLAWHETHQCNSQANVDRVALANLEVLRNLTPANRARLAKAEAANNEVVSLHTVGSFAKAIPIAEKALSERKEILGADNPLTAQSLENLAKCSQGLRDYDRALPLFVQALAIREKAQGKHVDTANSANQLGCLYVDRVDYAHAWPLFEQALNIRKELLGDDALDTAESFNNLAFLCQQKGDYSQAQSLFEHALAIRKNVLGENHRDTATTIENLASVYQNEGDDAKSQILFERALEVRRKVLGSDHRETAQSLNSLGNICRIRGDFMRAESLFAESLAIRKVVLGEKDPDTAQSFDNLGCILMELGDYARALPMLQRALAIRKETLGENHPATALSLKSLGSLNAAEGDEIHAKSYFEEAYEIQKRVFGEDHPETADTVDNLGVLAAAQGDYVRAGSLFSDVLKTRKKYFGEAQGITAESLNNLAYIYQRQDDYVRAEPLYEQALTINKTRHGSSHPATALNLLNLGCLYEDQREYSRALPLVEQSWEIYKTAFGEVHPCTIGAMRKLGSLYRELGDYDQAEPLLEKALSISKSTLGENHPLTAASRRSLADLYLARDNYNRAEPLYSTAVLTVLKHLDSAAGALPERQQLLSNQKARSYLDDYLNCVLRVEHDDHSAHEDPAAYITVLKWKGTVIARQRTARIASDSPELSQLFNKLRSAVCRWATLAEATPKADGAEIWRKQLNDLALQKERLEAELSLKSTGYRQAAKTVTPDDLLSKLPADSVLVDYLEIAPSKGNVPKNNECERPHFLLAFVVRPGRPIKLFDLGEVAPITVAIDRWRQDFGLSYDSQAAGKSLRDKIWQPLEASVGDAKLVLISPDGALGRFPFAALPGRSSGSYLIEDYRLALIPVPQLLPQLISEANRRKTVKDLLLVGGIDYDRSASSTASVLTKATVGPKRPWQRAHAPNGQWPFLRGSDSEVAFIKDLYQRATHATGDRIDELRGSDATKANFSALAPECSILHISTHGFFATPEKKSALAVSQARSETANLFGERFETVRGFSPGLLSGLVLAGANSPAKIPDDPIQLNEVTDDGLLSADEISFLPLGGAQLVVLSACETGLGEVAGGEGLIGIQRAFQVAGARTTIATLWKIDDQATRRIMEEFYRNYVEKNETPLDALRDAQLWALKNPSELRGLAEIKDSDTSRTPPYYWAAFQLSGDWR